MTLPPPPAPGKFLPPAPCDTEASRQGGAFPKVASVYLQMIKKDRLFWKAKQHSRRKYTEGLRPACKPSHPGEWGASLLPLPLPLPGLDSRRCSREQVLPGLPGGGRQHSPHGALLTLGQCAKGTHVPTWHLLPGLSPGDAFTTSPDGEEAGQTRSPPPGDNDPEEHRGPPSSCVPVCLREMLSPHLHPARGPPPAPPALSRTAGNSGGPLGGGSWRRLGPRTRVLPSPSAPAGSFQICLGKEQRVRPTPVPVILNFLTSTK